MTGKTFTQDRNKKISQSKMGKKLSDSHKEKLRLAWQNRKNTKNGK